MREARKRASEQRLLGLAHELAAVDLDDLAYKVVGPWRGQEQHRPCYLLGRTLAVHGDGGRHALAHVGRGETVVEGGGDDGGATPFTRMFSETSSLAIARVRVLTPPLAVAEAIEPGPPPLRAAIEVMLMILPLPCRLMIGTTARETR